MRARASATNRRALLREVGHSLARAMPIVDIDIPSENLHGNRVTATNTNTIHAHTLTSLKSRVSVPRRLCSNVIATINTRSE